MVTVPMEPLALPTKTAVPVTRALSCIVRLPELVPVSVIFISVETNSMPLSLMKTEPTVPFPLPIDINELTTILAEFAIFTMLVEVSATRVLELRIELSKRFTVAVEPPLSAMFIWLPPRLVRTELPVMFTVWNAKLAAMLLFQPTENPLTLTKALCNRRLEESPVVPFPRPTPSQLSMVNVVFERIREAPKFV